MRKVGRIVGLRPQRFNVGTRPAEMVFGAMGIRRQQSIVLAARGVVAVATCLLLANCASSGKFASRVDPKYGVSMLIDAVVEGLQQVSARCAPEVLHAPPVMGAAVQGLDFLAGAVDGEEALRSAFPATTSPIAHRG